MLLRYPFGNDLVRRVSLLTIGGLALLQNDDFVGQVLAASLSLMSILIAVVAIIAVEYKAVKTDPTLATPLYYLIISTIVSTLSSGLIGVLSLIYLRWRWPSVEVIYWSFFCLVALITMGLCVLGWYLALI